MGAEGGKVEAMNASTRSLCVILLVLTLCFAFLWGAIMGAPIVSTDAFVGILSAAITWLFKSRDDEKQSARGAAITKTTDTDPSGAKREVVVTASPGGASAPSSTIMPTKETT